MCTHYSWQEVSLLRLVFSAKNVSQKGCLIHVRPKEIFSPSLHIARDLYCVTDAIEEKLFLLNEGCRLKHPNDYNGDLNYLVKK